MGTYSTPLIVNQLSRHRTSWATDGKAGQGAYGTKYPQEYVGGVGFSIGSFDSTKYKVTGLQMQVVRMDGAGYYNRNIEFHLYMGYIEPNTLRTASSNYSKQKISIKTLNPVNSGATKITFTSEDLLKFNTYCLDAGSYYFMIFSGDGRASSSTSHTSNYTLIEDVDITLTYEDRSTDGTAENAKLGMISSVNFNPLPGFQYKAKWTLGNKEYISTEYTQNSPISYEIPKNWGEEFPTSFSKQGVVSLITYDLDGNEINTNDYEITYQCPSENSGPILQSFTHSCAQRYYSKSDFGIISEVFLASLSKFEYILSSSGQYGAEVAATLSIKNQNNNIVLKSVTSSFGRSVTATISNYIFNTPGTYIVTKTIKDSRGQSIVLESSVYKIIKGPSFISTPQIIKIDNEGNENVQGLYLKVIGILSNSKDTVSAVSTWFDTNHTEKRCTLTANSTNSYINTSQQMFAVDIASSVVIEIKSSLYFTNSNASSNLVYSLPAIRTSSANYLLHFKEGGQAIGIGSAAENDNSITMGWPVYFNNSIFLSEPLDPKYGGTGASSKTGALENLGAFPAAGGTIGTLSQPGSLTVTGKSILQDLTINSSPIISSTKHYSSIWFTPSIISGEGKRIAELFAYAANSNNSGAIDTSQVKLRQYSYNNNSTSILNYYDEFKFPITSAGKGKNDTYDILTTKDYPTVNNFYIMKNQTIQIQGICCVGFQKLAGSTGSTQTFFFSVPIEKRFHDEISSCKITEMRARFFSSTYIFNSDAYYDLIEFIPQQGGQTISLDKLSNTLKVSLNFNVSLANFRNNTIFCADIESITIQFT